MANEQVTFQKAPPTALPGTLTMKTQQISPATPVSIVWGGIGGVLSNQADLQAALDAKIGPDVPVDGVSYARKDQSWVPVTFPIPSDAPSDGMTYGRRNAAWDPVMSLTYGGTVSGAVTFEASALFNGPVTIDAALNVTGPITYTGTILGLSATLSQISDMSAVARTLNAQATQEDMRTTGLGLTPWMDMVVADTTLLTPDNCVDGAQVQVLSAYPSWRNLLDNGDMVFRTNTAVDATVAGSFVVDRWKAAFVPALKMDLRRIDAIATDGAPVYIGQSNRGVAAPSSMLQRYIAYIRLRNLVSGALGAAEYELAEQSLEGQTIRHLPWASVSAGTCFMTLSFAARASIAGTYFFSLFGTSNTRSYVQPFTLAANTWTQFAFVVPVDSSAGWTTAALDTTSAALAVRFCPAAGSNSQTGTTGAWVAGNFLTDNSGGVATFPTTVNASLDITGVQLEQGRTATPFEMLRATETSERLRRYYQRAGRGSLGVIQTVSAPAGAFRFRQQMITPMRAAPAISLNTTSITIEDWAIVSNAATGCSISSTVQNDGSYFDIAVAATGGVSGSSVAGRQAYMTADQIILNAQI